MASFPSNGYSEVMAGTNNYTGSNFYGSSCPKTPIVPVSNDDLTNKLYVDSVTGGGIIGTLTDKGSLITGDGTQAVIFDQNPYQTALTTTTVYEWSALANGQSRVFSTPVPLLIPLGAELTITYSMTDSITGTLTAITSTTITITITAFASAAYVPVTVYTTTPPAGVLAGPLPGSPPTGFFNINAAVSTPNPPIIPTNTMLTDGLCFIHINTTPTTFEITLLNPSSVVLGSSAPEPASVFPAPVSFNFASGVFISTATAFQIQATALSQSVNFQYPTGGTFVPADFCGQLNGYTLPYSSGSIVLNDDIALVADPLSATGLAWGVINTASIGAVTSVSGGTNIVMSGTIPAPVVNLRNPLTSELNMGAQSLRDSASAVGTSGQILSCGTGGQTLWAAATVPTVVNAGTNISVTGTSSAPIVNLLNPLTSELNMGSQSLRDSANAVGTSGQILSCGTGGQTLWAAAPSSNPTITDTNTNATYYPTFVAGSGVQPLLADIATGPISLNPSNGNFNVVDTLKLTQTEVAVGKSAGLTTQGTNAVAVGLLAGTTTQGANAVAVGRLAGNDTQSLSAVAVGYQAGQTTQGARGIAIGFTAGQNNQGNDAVAIGHEAGDTSQGANAVAVGNGSGLTGQSTNAVAVGNGAGATTQGTTAVAVGRLAGNNNQGLAAVAVGFSAGGTGQGDNGVAIGSSAGATNQAITAVAVGFQAGQTTQGAGAVAVGSGAGATSQGANAIAIGNSAGSASQTAGSICLNATGVAVNPNQAGLFIDPIRSQSTGSNILSYDTTSKEVLSTNNLSVQNITATTPYNFSVISLFTDAAARNAALPSPYLGQFCFLTGLNLLQFYNGGWASIDIVSEVLVSVTGFTLGSNYEIIYVTGANVVTGSPVSGGFTIVRFYPTTTTSGTISLSLTAPITYLVVGGGGGGGGVTINVSNGGGGGAGDYRTSTDTMVSATSYALTVGGGGAGGLLGGVGANSSLAVVSGTITSIGGGGGGSQSAGGSGGSGGGAGGGSVSFAGGVGTGVGGVSNGGSYTFTGVGAGYYSGGGGGSSTAGSAGDTTSLIGNGGNGTANTITGASVVYAGGGGGGSNGGSGVFAVGGTGGGGNGGNLATNFATAGTNGRGSGGGGGGNGLSSNLGANGGAGVVIVRFPSFV